MFPCKELFGVLDLDIVLGKKEPAGSWKICGARAGEKNGARFCRLKSTVHFQVRYDRWIKEVKTHIFTALTSI